MIGAETGDCKECRNTAGICFAQCIPHLAVLLRLPERVLKVLSVKLPPNLPIFDTSALRSVSPQVILKVLSDLEAMQGFWASP